MNTPLKVNILLQVYKDLENKKVDVGGWGDDVNEAYKIKKIVQNVLIKLKISLLDYSVLSNKYLCIYNKSNIL
jgi:hypothetical protein